MRSWRAGVAAGLLAACPGCTSSEPLVPSEPPDTAQPGIAIAVPPSVSFVRGEVGGIAVTLTRTGSFTGSVTVTLLGLPEGVTAEPVTVAAGVATALLSTKIDLLAAAARTSLTVRAEADGVASASASVSLQVVPAPIPFSGTIFIDPDIITAADATAYEGLAYVGRGARLMYDRRVPGWVTEDAYLFDARFSDGLETEVQVNPEFGSPAAAQAQAERYAEVIGRLPTALRVDVQTVWIHQGVEPFGGGNNNLLIHVGQAALYEADGILEETFVHEAAHTSLDAAHASSAGWVAAQGKDGTFISTYARDFPTREDVAETFLPYLAVRYRADRISKELADIILRAIPHRLVYLDGAVPDLLPEGFRSARSGACSPSPTAC